MRHGLSVTRKVYCFCNSWIVLSWGPCAEWMPNGKIIWVKISVYQLHWKKLPLSYWIMVLSSWVFLKWGLTTEVNAWGARGKKEWASLQNCLVEENYCANSVCTTTTQMNTKNKTGSPMPKSVQQSWNTPCFSTQPCKEIQMSPQKILIWNYPCDCGALAIRTWSTACSWSNVD